MWLKLYDLVSVEHWIQLRVFETLSHIANKREIVREATIIL